jgi:hypothetical protein
MVKLYQIGLQSEKDNLFDTCFHSLGKWIRLGCA